MRTNDEARQDAIDTRVDERKRMASGATVEEREEGVFSVTFKDRSRFMVDASDVDEAVRRARVEWETSRGQAAK